MSSPPRSTVHLQPPAVRSPPAAAADASVGVHTSLRAGPVSPTVAACLYCEHKASALAASASAEPSSSCPNSVSIAASTFMLHCQQMRAVKIRGMAANGRVSSHLDENSASVCR